MKFKTLSPNSTLALYLALRAARKHAIAVEFSNDSLKACLGKKEGQRLSRPQLRKFAATFKPIFQHHVIDEERYGDIRLALYFNEQDAPAKRKQIVGAFCPTQAGINKELGIELID